MYFSRLLIICIIASIVLISGTSSLYALQIRGYSAALHDRFTGFANSPVENPTFIHQAYDFTGVGWHTNNLNRQLTLVSPIHIIGADHFKPGVGATINFLSSAGVIISRTVASQEVITKDSATSDIFIATLNEPIEDDDQVAFAQSIYAETTNVTIPGLGTVPNYNPDYLNQDLIVLGKSARGGRGSISTIFYDSGNTTQVIGWTYATSSGDADDCYLETGDSGSPLFIDDGYNNDKSGIVAVNLSVSTSTDPYTSYASFIPHYFEEINTVLEDEGYQLTSLYMSPNVKPTTSLALTHTTPSTIIRAGYDFSIDLNLANTGAETAENIKVVHALPTGSSVSVTSSSEWFDDPDTSVIRQRKATLDASANTDVNVTLNIPTAGTATHEISYYSDQSPSTTESFSYNVIESFISWGSELSDATDTGDDDDDGIFNLLEYAFGGDPTEPSQNMENSSIALLPTYEGGQFSYIRRTDYSDRALTYLVTTSTSLESNSWTDISELTFISSPSVEVIDTNYEKVVTTIPESETIRFFRVEVTLSE